MRREGGPLESTPNTQPHAHLELGVQPMIFHHLVQESQPGAEADAGGGGPPSLSPSWTLLPREEVGDTWQGVRWNEIAGLAS